MSSTKQNSVSSKIIFDGNQVHSSELIKLNSLAAQIPGIVEDLTKAEQLNFVAFREDPEGMSSMIFHDDDSVMVTVARRDGVVRAYVSAGLDEPQHEINLARPEAALVRVLRPVGAAN